MLIETAKPLTVRRSSGDLRLIPGHPIELPDGEALRLIAKASGKVRVVSPIIVEPAVKPDGTALKPVYWERQGRIIGPGQPEFFFRDSAGQVGLIIRYEGELVSVADTMLRTRTAYENQRVIREIEPIRSL